MHLDIITCRLLMLWEMYRLLPENVTIKNIKSGEEITANYNLYTYPKTGIGIQTL